MPKRTPENVILDNICPSCQRRIWYQQEPSLARKRRYVPPKWFRDMFKRRLGTMPLGYFRLGKCEVCQKKMAIFDLNRGPLRDQVVVLYSCTLLSFPLDSEDGTDCKDLKNCYNCPLKKTSEDFVAKK